MKTILILIFVTFITLSAGADPDRISIIVNSENPLTSLTQDEISSLFLKKTKLWSNGTQVRFFDRNDESAVRGFFLKNLIKRTVRDVELYWIGQKLYTGNSAPLQVSSDYMMASMVAKFPGAIGYVSSEFESAKGVKIIEVKAE